MCSSLELITRDISSLCNGSLRVQESLPLFLKYFFNYEKFHLQRIDFPIKYTFVENSSLSISGKRNSDRWDFGKYARFYKEADENRLVVVSEKDGEARIKLLMTDHWHHEYIFSLKSNRWYLTELRAFLHSKLPIEL